MIPEIESVILMCNLLEETLQGLYLSSERASVGECGFAFEEAKLAGFLQKQPEGREVTQPLLGGS